MTSDLRSTLTRLLDEYDGGVSDNPVLRGLFDELRAEVLADKVRRDEIAAVVGEVARDADRWLDIPCEPLFATREYRAVVRGQQRLHMAFDLFCAVMRGQSFVSLTSDNGTTRQWCWRMADSFIADHDKPTTPPAQPASVASEPSAPLSAAERTLLLWLADYQPTPTSAYPVELGPEVSASAHRDLLKRGLIRACPWEDSFGWQLSEAGEKRAKAILGDLKQVA